MNGFARAGTSRHVGLAQKQSGGAVERERRAHFGNQRPECGYPGDRCQQRGEHREDAERHTGAVVEGDAEEPAQRKEVDAHPEADDRGNDDHRDLDDHRHSGRHAPAGPGKREVREHYDADRTPANVGTGELTRRGRGRVPRMPDLFVRR